MSETDELRAELRRLRTDEGIAAFIATRSGLDADRVRRLYHLGQPWPLTNDPAWDFDRRAIEAGVDVDNYAAAMVPLLELSELDKRARKQRIAETAHRFIEKVVRGDEITPEEIAAVEEDRAAYEAEFVSPVLEQHLDHLERLTGEPRAILVTVLQGALAVVQRTCDIYYALHALEQSSPS